MGVSTFNSTEKALKFTIFFIKIRDYGKKVTESIILTAQFILLAPSDECAGPINQPTAVKGLESMGFQA